MAVVTATVIGVGISAYSAQQSFAAAAEAKRDGEEAAAAAQTAMDDAKRKAEKDYYGGLAVPLDAYDAAFENNLAVAQQQTEALQEGDARALAAGAGRIGAQAAETGEETRIAMGEEISDLNQMKAQSKDAMNQQLIEMDVANARQQNEIAAQSKAAQNQATQQGLSATAGAITGAASMVDLYSKKADPNAVAEIADPGAGGAGSLSRQGTEGLQLGGPQGSAFGSKKLGLGQGGNPFDNPFSKKPQFGNFTPSWQSPNRFFR